ncbi:MAG TPA: CHAT domain-containing protein [Thermoanaerobaculia bacterium]|nr:CHAT domain-containing protein [Thermoanaerobaculia bacterium]
MLLGLTPAVAVLAWQGWLGVFLDSFGPSQQEKLETLDREAPRTLAPTGARLIVRPLPAPEVPGTSGSARGGRGHLVSLESQLLTLRLDPTNPEKLKTAEQALVAELKRVGEAADARHRARLLSDLAAVRFGRAVGGGPPLLYFTALAAAEDACSLAADLAEALFNRALLLEALHLPIQAEEAWRGFLALAPRPPWADEAQAAAERLAFHTMRQGTQAATVPGGRGVAFASSRAASIEDRLENLRGQPSPREPEIRALLTEADVLGLPHLAASAAKFLAYRTSLDGRFRPALDQYADAQRRYEELGDVGKAAVSRAMRAEIFDALGQTEEAMVEVMAALAVAPGIADPWDRYSVYWVAGNTVASTASSAAIPLWREATEACREMPERRFCPVDGRIRLAKSLGDTRAAGIELEKAEQTLHFLPDSLEKKRTELDVALARAELLGREPEAALPELEEAARLYLVAIAGLEALRSPANVAEARLARANVLSDLGRQSEARAELEAGLVSLRRWDQDLRFLPEAAEIGAPPALREIFERLIELHLAAETESANLTAFLLSEEMRDRLAPRLNRWFLPFSAADLAAALAQIPPGTAVVEYVVLGSPAGARSAVAFVLSAGSLRTVPLAVGPGLESSLKAVRAAAEEEDLEGWRRSTAELWRLLVAPVLAELAAGTERLVILPDSEIHGVPFRGVWDPGRERYLDEDFQISLAPSLRALLRGSQQPDTSKRPGSVLSLGFEGFSALGLSDLPRASEEAFAVRNAYGAATALDCPVRDWVSLRSCLPRAEVVHLATHAAANSREDSWSWLALPMETVRLDQLWRELPPLPRTRLVVLAACESTATPAAGEGLGGLARPFLARGVGAVVGTLWPIRDTDALALFPQFHHEYREEGDAGSALRRAREELADWRGRPWAWGGVMAIEAGTFRRED